MWKYDYRWGMSVVTFGTIWLAQLCSQSVKLDKSKLHGCTQRQYIITIAISWPSICWIGIQPVFLVTGVFIFHVSVIKHNVTTAQSKMSYCHNKLWQTAGLVQIKQYFCNNTKCCLCISEAVQNSNIFTKTGAQFSSNKKHRQNA